MNSNSTKSTCIPQDHQLDGSNEGAPESPLTRTMPAFARPSARATPPRVYSKRNYSALSEAPTAYSGRGSVVSVETITAAREQVAVETITAAREQMLALMIAERQAALLAAIAQQTDGAVDRGALLYHMLRFTLQDYSMIGHHTFLVQQLRESGLAEPAHPPLMTTASHMQPIQSASSAESRTPPSPSDPPPDAASVDQVETLMESIGRALTDSAEKGVAGDLPDLADLEVEIIYDAEQAKELDALADEILAHCA
jgi:hypothetical protein